jgi:hypothetical protein
MHDPMTQAFNIRLPWQEKYASFITIWHVDPEKPGTGNRSDDSCGWFDRTPGEYADAVAYLLKDEAFMHDARVALERRVRTPYPFYEGISKEQLYGKRLSPGDALALILMVATYLELRRWWNGEKGNGGAHANWWLRTFTRKRSVVEFATTLALNPIDNLSSIESPEAVVRLTAAALNREFRPWYKHPRWHFWHWKFQVHPLQSLNRWLFKRCATCGKRLRWNEAAFSNGGGSIMHEQCTPWRSAKPAHDLKAHEDSACGSVH